VNTKLAQYLAYGSAKTAATRGMKEILKLVARGDLAGADALAKTPGALRWTAAGSQIKDLGRGGEGLATLVAHPEYGVSVRKLYEPGGLSSPDMILRKEQVGRALGNNPLFAKFLGAEQTPANTPMHFYEYVRGSPMGRMPIEKARPWVDRNQARAELSNLNSRLANDPQVQSNIRKNPMMRNFYRDRLRDLRVDARPYDRGPEAMRNAIAQGHRAVRNTGLGYSSAWDIRDANMMRTPEGNIKIIDYLPFSRGETYNIAAARRMQGENIIATTPAGRHLLDGSAQYSAPVSDPALKLDLLGPQRPSRVMQNQPAPAAPAAPAARASPPTIWAPVGPANPAASSSPPPPLPGVSIPDDAFAHLKARKKVDLAKMRGVPTV